jgi:hypothetical protein
MIGDYPHQIAMGNLASGLYIVSVQEKQGALYQFKVVKK